MVGEKIPECQAIVANLENDVHYFAVAILQVKDLS